MNIITEPKVTVVGQPLFDPHPNYQLPPDGTDGEKLIAMGGKGCYDSYSAGGRPVSDHIKTLIDSGHGSVLEHANYSLFIEGISRGCSHEFVRHRAGFAYSQRSTRYVDEGECNVVLEPYFADLRRSFKSDELHGSELVVYEDYMASLKESVASYKIAVERLLKLGPYGTDKRDQRKWARGKARQLLPIAIETRMTVTANLRAWRHFIIMRSGRFAEPEIRRLAGEIYAELYPLAPIVFDDMKATLVNDFTEFTSENSKV